MNLKPIGSNKTELTLEKDSLRIRILFSYEIPVACDILTPEGMMYYRTENFYSKTTSKHINSWMPTDQAEEKPQSFFDDLVK